ncbi:uncharacterized protein LOC132276912 [Cornus florida]|uniref:uncharacterized protein LOC132276912 n=1 Tax=Cornus florida TaxID=4283 RepID=UPI0028A2162F|nr:uncharacterized protein LOC132276912 [Cornus florida]
MAGSNMDLFDVYFRRADLDQDGRISGAEAVSFFQGSSLPKNVLAQIWMHADQSRSGFLGRAEFYNALKLVTVAQSKRDLTPDIVKAALYGPASAKIPAPQINLALAPAPQLNPMAAASAIQMGAVAPTASQNHGFGGQVPPNANMNPQIFSSQGNHSARPPLPTATGTASRPAQGAAGPAFPTGGSNVGLGLPNSNISSDWLGGRTGGTPTGATSQVPNKGISQSMASVVSKPQDLISTPSLTAVKDFKASVGSGNGFASDQIFGGDVFSATPSVTMHGSSGQTYSVNSAPASSAVAPVSTGSHSSAKPDPLESLQSNFMRQSRGGQLQQTQTQLKPNQQVVSQHTSSLASAGISVEVGKSASEQSQIPWPRMTPAGVQKYTKVFVEVDSDRDGKITGNEARNLFLSWRLPREVLKQVWDLSDQDNDSMLSLREFCIALYLMERYREGRSLPPTLPSNVLLDETLLSLTGQVNASYGPTAWGPTAGLRPQQGIHGAQPATPASGLRPSMPITFPQADATMQFNHQKARMPSTENSHLNQLRDGEQNSLNLNSEEPAEAQKNVENKEKVLLDSKEKLEFYRTKMQDLVLYKSRCDNRLNEITERALADKREAESLAKKYEEKYKQVAEIASKLSIEEATFRDLQGRKTELHQAIINMEQGGSADGILQVRADRIQSDLEELMRALTERCKKNGIHVKSAALFELPIGWQPGVPEVAAVWDEDWDKFEDEGFSFDVGMPPKTKSTSVWNENSSPIDSLSPDSLSHADDKSEKLFAKGEPALESEDELAKSPPGSPVRQAAFEIPSQEYSENHFRKSPEADTETHRSFDEPSWGTFDNNDDIDSVWGFNGVGTRNSDHEKHGEKYFFTSGDLDINPIKTESPNADGTFERKSPFTFEDSVPSTPFSRAGNSPPRYSVGSVDPFFDNSSRFDSFSMNDHGFSPRRDTLTRFDSIDSSRGFDHSRGFSSFDDADPFGSNGPFKVSTESQTAKKGSDNWSSF